MTANTFGIHQSTVSKLMLKVSQSITEISWPKISLSAQKSKRNHKKKFSKLEVKFDMTQALGVIDGTHIPIQRIQRPMENSKEYFNYKGFNSLSVQVLFDFPGVSMDIARGQAHKYAKFSEKLNRFFYIRIT